MRAVRAADGPRRLARLPRHQRSRSVVPLSSHDEVAEQPPAGADAERAAADADAERVTAHADAERAAAHAAAERLRTVDLEPLGRFADASNATLLVLLLDDGAPSLAQVAADLGREPTIEDLAPDHLAVYKPRRGEAPLWDFPGGTLHRREVAAYEVSEALGWGLVPLTVLRDDGPFGPGSVQRFVPHDPELHYFRLLEVGSAAVITALRRMVVFDLVIDNADRKGGHVLLEGVIDDVAAGPADPADPAGDVEVVVDGPVRLVDHGVAFNVEHKLRTVAWEFAGEPISDDAREALVRLTQHLDGDLGEQLTGLLAPEEIAVLHDRVARLTDLERLPAPTGPRDFPWPPL